jgi:hypothetical protein
VLPRWIRRVTIRNLRIGSARVSLQFDRDGDRTRHHVLDKSGTLHVLEVPPPQDVHRADADWRDRIAQWLLEHAPGQRAAALRIALGLE